MVVSKHFLRIYIAINILDPNNEQASAADLVHRNCSHNCLFFVPDHKYINNTSANAIEIFYIFMAKLTDVLVQSNIVQTCGI